MILFMTTVMILELIGIYATWIGWAIICYGVDVSHQLTWSFYVSITHQCQYKDIPVVERNGWMALTRKRSFVSLPLSCEN